MRNQSSIIVIVWNAAVPASCHHYHNQSAHAPTNATHHYCHCVLCNATHTHTSAVYGGFLRAKLQVSCAARNGCGCCRRVRHLKTRRISALSTFVHTYARRIACVMCGIRNPFLRCDRVRTTHHVVYGCINYFRTCDSIWLRARHAP